jgi:hypothetical protein
VRLFLEGKLTMQNGTDPFTSGQMKDLAATLVQAVPNLTFAQAGALLGRKNILSRVLASAMREMVFVDDPIVRSDTKQAYVFALFMDGEREYELTIGPFESTTYRQVFMTKWRQDQTIPPGHVLLFIPSAQLIGGPSRLLSPKDFKGFMPVQDQIKPNAHLANIIKGSLFSDKELADGCMGQVDVEIIRKLREGELDPLPAFDEIGDLLNFFGGIATDLGYTFTMVTG